MDARPRRAAPWCGSSAFIAPNGGLGTMTTLGSSWCEFRRAFVRVRSSLVRGQCGAIFTVGIQRFSRVKELKMKMLKVLLVVVVAATVLSIDTAPAAAGGSSQSRPIKLSYSDKSYNPACSHVWVQIGNSFSSREYKFPKKGRKYYLSITTKAWYGSSWSPKTCGLKPYRMDKVAHVGHVNAKWGGRNANLPHHSPVSISTIAGNRLWLTSSNKNFRGGSSHAKGKTVCAYSRHLIVVEGRPHNLWRRTGPGPCTFR